MCVYLEFVDWKIGVTASNVILLGDEEAEEGWSRPWKPCLIKNLHFSCVLEVIEKGLIILSSMQIMSKPSRNGQKDYVFVEASKNTCLFSIAATLTVLFKLTCRSLEEFIRSSKAGEIYKHRQRLLRERPGWMVRWYFLPLRLSMGFCISRYCVNCICIRLSL